MINSMRSLGIALTIATITASGTFQASVGFGQHHGDSHGCRQCPNCDYVCKLTVEKVDEEKTGFDVESKVVCIPRVVFPWQKKCNPCANNGARLRTVCALTTEKYKCPKCEYSWKAEKRPDPCVKMIGDNDFDAAQPDLPEPPQNPQETIPASEQPVQAVPQVEPLAYGIVDPQREAAILFKY